MPEPKVYRYTTPEGFKLCVELFNEGIEDGYVVQDWNITFEPSPGYQVDDEDYRIDSTLVVSTSRQAESRKRGA